MSTKIFKCLICLFILNLNNGYFPNQYKTPTKKKKTKKKYLHSLSQQIDMTFCSVYLHVFHQSFLFCMNSKKQFKNTKYISITSMNFGSLLNYLSFINSYQKRKTTKKQNKNEKPKEKKFHRQIRWTVFFFFFFFCFFLGVFHFFP